MSSKRVVLKKNSRRALRRIYFTRLWRVLAARAYHQVLLRVIGFQRRQRTDYTTLSYPKALEKTRCESIEIHVHP